jgi:hypothetical protein
MQPQVLARVPTVRGYCGGESAVFRHVLAPNGPNAGRSRLHSDPKRPHLYTATRVAMAAARGRKIGTYHPAGALPRSALLLRSSNAGRRTCFPRHRVFQAVARGGEECERIGGRSRLLPVLRGRGDISHGRHANGKRANDNEADREAGVAARPDRPFMPFAGDFWISQTAHPLFRGVTTVFFVTVCLSYSTHATVMSDTIVTIRM